MRATLTSKVFSITLAKLSNTEFYTVVMLLTFILNSIPSPLTLLFQA